MFPVLIHLGAFTLQTYTVLVDAGILLGLGWLYFSAPAEKKGRWVDAGLAAVFGALVGARLVYAFANSSYYFAHPEEIFLIWLGGLSWVGAVAGGIMGAGLYASRRREPLAPLWDAAAWPLLCMSFLGWAGCLAAGAAYGAEVAPGGPLAWLAQSAPDLYGVTALRWPTQILGMVWSMAALGLMALSAFVASPLRTRLEARAGARGGYALVLVALGAAAVSVLRGDPDPGLGGGLRLDTAGSLLVLLSALGGWGVLMLRPAQASAAPAEPPVPEEPPPAAPAPPRGAEPAAEPAPPAPKTAEDTDSTGSI